MKFTFFLIFFNEPSRGIMKNPEEGNFPIIFISRLLPRLSFTLNDSALVCVGLNIKKRRKARPIILSHIQSCRFLITIRQQQVLACHLRQCDDPSEELMDMNLFFCSPIPNFQQREGSLYCSSFPYFHGFMTLYVFTPNFFLRLLPSSDKNSSIVDSHLAISPPPLVVHPLHFYAERNENRKNSIFFLVIIRYNQITSDTRVREESVLAAKNMIE